MRVLALSCVVALQWVGAVAAQVVLSGEAQRVEVREGLVVDAKGSWSRRLINTDPVVQRVVDGVLGHVGAAVPKVGERLVAGDDASPQWEAIQAGDDGTFQIAGGRYLLTTVTSERERVMVLEARGHGMVYVNGEPRVGDPYGFGYVHVPVLMREGVNTLLIASAGRGAVKVRLRAAEGMVEINTADITAPDVLDEGVSVYWMGVPVMNNTNVAQPVSIGTFPADAKADELERRKVLPIQATQIVLPPLSVMKVPVRFDATHEADGSVNVFVSYES
jgi:hypothetical protein